MGAALFFALAGCAGPGARLTPPPAWPRGDSGVLTAPKLNGLALRVLLRHGGQGLKTTAPGGLRLVSLAGRGLAAIPAQGRARLGSRGGRLEMDGDDLRASQAWVLPLEPGDTLRVDGKRYRGRLLLAVTADGLALINVVGLEDYLRAVLPAEVSPSGPAEALRAQAVAARGFALVQAQRAGDRPWDLDNTADSQVYGSREVETAATDAAVSATRGEVLAWHGALARTYFHSNSGGATADAREVWRGADDPAYLAGVLDPWSENQGHYRWTWALPMAEAGARLERAGLIRGGLEGVEPGRRSESGRWLSVRLVERGGRAVTVGANAFRRALGADKVRSTRFDVRVAGSSLVFQGRGWGHGVGLSQEGAFAMARAGWDYRAILYYYYPGTSLDLLRE